MSSPMHLAIDKASPVPLYHQLAQALEHAIRTGVLGPGVRLEKETELAARLHVARSTVSRAVNQLVDAGLVVRKPRVGTHVAGAEHLAPPSASSTPSPPSPEVGRDAGRPQRHGTIPVPRARGRNGVTPSRKARRLIADAARSGLQCGSLRVGDRVEVRSRCSLPFKGLVDDVMPQLKVVWIREFRTGERVMISLEEHRLFRI